MKRRSCVGLGSLEKKGSVLSVQNVDVREFGWEARLYGSVVSLQKVRQTFLNVWSQRNRVQTIPLSPVFKSFLISTLYLLVFASYLLPLKFYSVPTFTIFYFYYVGAKPVDPRIYISSNICDSKWISIYDRKQWEHLNGLQIMLADLMANKYFSNNGLSKMLDEVRLTNDRIMYIFMYFI